MNIFETCAENYVAIGSSAVLCSPFPVGSSTLTAGPTHYTSLLTITQIGCQILIFLYIIIFLSFPKKDVEEYKAMTGRCGDQSKRLVMSFQFILYTAACCHLLQADQLIHCWSLAASSAEMSSHKIQIWHFLSNIELTSVLRLAGDINT